MPQLAMSLASSNYAIENIKEYIKKLEISKILIIDDQPESILSIKDFFEKLGCKVDFAHYSGVNASVILKQINDAELIVLDCYLSENNISPSENYLRYITRTNNITFDKYSTEYKYTLLYSDKNIEGSLFEDFKKACSGFDCFLYQAINKEMDPSDNDKLLKFIYILDQMYSNKLYLNLLSELDKKLIESTKYTTKFFKELPPSFINQLYYYTQEEGSFAHDLIFDLICNKIRNQLYAIETNKLIENSLEELKSGAFSDTLIPDDLQYKVKKLIKFDSSINKRMDYINVGDIFHFSNQNNQFGILINQICDLSPRHHDLNNRMYSNAILIKGQSKDAPIGPPVKGVGLKKYGLNYIEFNNENKYLEFEFTQTFTLPLSILDLCTKNESGKAIIELKELTIKKRKLKNSIRLLRQEIICSSNLSGELFGELIPSEEDPDIYKSDNCYFLIKGSSNYLKCSVEIKPNNKKYNLIIDFMITRICRCINNHILDLIHCYNSYSSRIGLPLNIERPSFSKIEVVLIDQDNRQIGQKLISDKAKPGSILYYGEHKCLINLKSLEGYSNKVIIVNETTIKIDNEERSQMNSDFQVYNDDKVYVNFNSHILRLKPFYLEFVRFEIKKNTLSLKYRKII